MTNLDAAGITYRTATEADFDAVARLWLESWQSTGLAIARFATEEGNRKRIALEVANGWNVTLAVAGQRIVGFLATKPVISVLDQLFVAPDMKGKGIGKALLASAKAEMPTALHSVPPRRTRLHARFMTDLALCASELRRTRRWVTLLLSTAGSDERVGCATPCSSRALIQKRPVCAAPSAKFRGIKSEPANCRGSPNRELNSWSQELLPRM
jgi:GNAT superfamily N-acetyltransferase